MIGENMKKEKYYAISKLLLQSLSENKNFKMTPAISFILSNYILRNSDIASTSLKHIMLNLGEEKMYERLKKKGQDTQKSKCFMESVQNILDYLKLEIKANDLSSDEHVLIENIIATQKTNHYGFVMITQKDFDKIMNLKNVDKYSVLNVYLIIKGTIKNTKSNDVSLVQNSSWNIGYPSMDYIMTQTSIGSRTTLTSYLNILKDNEIIWYDNFEYLKRSGITDFCNIYCDYDNAEHIYRFVKFQIDKNHSLTPRIKNINHNYLRKKYSKFSENFNNKA